MKIAVIGAGASGMMYSIMRKKYYPDDEIVIIEKENQIGKKVLATGNGRCNLLHNCEKEELYKKYRDYQKTQQLFSEIDFSYLATTFHELGLDLRNEEGRYYPRSENAKTVVEIFNYWLKKYQIKILLKTTLIDYSSQGEKIKLIMNNHSDLMVDRLVVAVGGSSSPSLGSNGAFFSVAKQHHYYINKCFPGLTPIKVQEDISSLFGLRVKADVRLISKNKGCLFQEKGEVQFKKDGLGGIVIMNASSLIARNNQENDQYKIVLDLFPEFDEQALFQSFIEKTKYGYPYLDGSLPSLLARYIEKITKTKGRKSEEELKLVVNLMKNLTFTFQELYPFSQSQVTIGGLSFTNIDDHFQSINEKNVFFIGEVLDNDGLCGGYNLMWAWASAIKAAQYR